MREDNKIVVWKHSETGRLFEKEVDYKAYISECNRFKEKRFKEKRLEEIKAKEKYKLLIASNKKQLEKALVSQQEHKIKLEHFINHNSQVMKIINAMDDAARQIEKGKQTLKVLAPSLKNYRKDLTAEYKKKHLYDPNLLNRIKRRIFLYEYRYRHLR